MKDVPGFIVREIDDNGSAPYMIFFAATDSHSHLADRLAVSIKRLGLPFMSTEIPTIHRSVSPRGSDDATYCKAHLISTVMSDLQRPIVYLDADFIVEARPFLFDYLCAENYEFGVYNWLAAPSNQAYVAVETAGSDPVFQFSHSVDYLSRTQLVCSGGVQFWGNSGKSRELLAQWQDCVANNPRCPDDHSLDYAFNNVPHAERLTTFWLPRAYARYVWWVLDNPVINHPDRPYAGSDFEELTNFRGKPRVHMDQLQPRILTGEERALKAHPFVVNPDGTPHVVG